MNKAREWDLELRRPSKTRQITAHYERRIAPNRESYDVLDWGTRESQLARFRVLLDSLVHAPVASETPSLLDVGCGLTDLCSFLEQCRLAIDYTGVDLTPGILAEARRRHPGRRLVQADVFEGGPFRDNAFDVSYCSGVFNLQLGNNDAFARRGLAGLARYARCRALANFLHIRTREKYPHCHYFDPDELMTYAATLVPRVELVDDYLTNDFTIVMWP